MNTQEIFQYYTEQEAEKHAYYSIPKELFTNPRYKDISTDAKLLYGLLRDRNQLSIKNKWVDSEGRIYIIFTREEAGELLNYGYKYIVKLFKELKEVGLIREIRQGLNKPNITYVGKIIPESIENTRKCSTNISGNVQETYQDISKKHTSNTDINNTDISKVNQSVEPKQEINETDGRTEEYQKEVEQILEQSNVELYTAKEFITAVVKKLYIDTQIPYVLKMGLTHTEIKTRLQKLSNRHIDSALLKLKDCKTNKERYFMKCLLTAIIELDIDDYVLELQQDD